MNLYVSQSSYHHHHHQNIRALPPHHRQWWLQFQLGNRSDRTFVRTCDKNKAQPMRETFAHSILLWPHTARVEILQRQHISSQQMDHPENRSRTAAVTHYSLLLSE